LNYHFGGFDFDFVGGLGPEGFFCRVGQKWMSVSITSYTSVVNRAGVGLGSGASKVDIKASTTTYYIGMSICK
jgi:hypothetical protein